MLLRPKLGDSLKRSLVGVSLVAWPVLFVMSVPTAVPPAAPRNPRAIPGSFLVDLTPGADAGPLRELLRTQGGRVHHAYSLIPSRYNVRGLPAGSEVALSRLPGVLRVRPDLEVRAILIDSVPLIGALFDDDSNPETPTGLISAWKDYMFDYDLLKSTVAADFDAAASCLETNDSRDTQALERKSPAMGTAFFYLVRARNDCPGGDGGIGFTASGVARNGRTCP